MENTLNNPVRHMPSKYLCLRSMAHWANEKDQFERVTGWKGRSNVDTRAAAFFGFLGLKKIDINCEEKL